jgi:caffeoyl-CoA O-methyltransferase
VGFRSSVPRSAAVDAHRIFEFGSGFGYSAYWFARALPPDGEVILTEVNADELEMAREYFDRGGFTERAVFEQGDALETVAKYDVPFDIVLIDVLKHEYEAAFEAVREKIASGGIVVADNMIRATNIEFDMLVCSVEDDTTSAEMNRQTRGIVDYLTRSYQFSVRDGDTPARKWNGGQLSDRLRSEKVAGTVDLCRHNPYQQKRNFVA